MQLAFGSGTTAGASSATSIPSGRFSKLSWGQFSKHDAAEQLSSATLRTLIR
jgi:hypothetical protein